MRRITGIAICLAIIGGLVAPALAHKERYKSRVTISNPPLTARYEGEVKSKSKACVRRRLVQLWADQPDPTPDFLVETIEADSEGRWSHEFVGDAYYAKVLRVKKTPGNHKHICKPDRSPTIE